MKYNVKEMKELKAEGKTNAEIAEYIGCSEKLVKSKLSPPSSKKPVKKKKEKVDDYNKWKSDESDSDKEDDTQEDNIDDDEN